MGFWGFIGSIASGIGSAISGAVSAIGSGLSSFVSGVGTVIGTVIDAIPTVAESIGRFANTFLQALGILKPEEKVEDIGERALQAKDHGITLDKFERFDDYMAALRDFPLDAEISAKRGRAERMVAGLGLGTVAVEDKFQAERGSLNGLWLLPIANPDYFTPERMQSIISTGRLADDVFAYLEKRLSGADALRFEEKLTGEASGAPLGQAEREDLFANLDKARENWGQINQELEAKLKQGE